MGMLGDVFSSAVSLFNAEKNRDFNYDAQSRKEAYDTEMSNTQYQRMVQDLSAAGLSPMLAYSKTGHAPTGQAASSNTSIEAPKFGETSMRTAQAALAREQVEVAKTQAQLNESSAAKAQAEAAMYNQETENKKLYPGMNDAQIKELIARASQHGSSALNLDEVTKRIAQEINLNKPAEQFKQENPNVAKYMHPIQESLRTIFEGLGLLRGSSAMPFVTKNAPRGK